MKRIAFLSAASAALLACAANDAKNVYDVPYRTMPAEARDILAEPGVWDANFRPYDQADTVDLWTDSRVVRDVAGGAAREGERPTAIAFSCDERGLNAFVACGQMAPQLEFYYLVGAADRPGIGSYYHMFYDGHDLKDYTMTVPDRHSRHMRDYTRVEEFNVSDRDTLVKISWSWEGMWDYLPFLDGQADFWRVSMIHWAPGGNRSWGGKVHQVSAAGYLRLPAFTEEQQTAVMKHVLRCAVRQFGRRLASYPYNPGNGVPYVSANTNAYHLAEIARHPRSYVCYAEDPAFRPALVRLVRRCQGLAARLESFGALPFDARVAYYREASAALFNFERDVEDAYAKSMRGRLAARLGARADAVAPADDVPAVEHPLNEWNRRYSPDLDLDKADARLAELADAIARASSPDARAKAAVTREQLLYRLARDDGARHLQAMREAALAPDVSAATALTLLASVRQFRRDYHRLFDDDFSFERLAWDRLTGDAAARDDPALRALYYRLLGDWIRKPFVSEKRARNHELSYEHSSERLLAVMEKGARDAVLARDPVRRYESVMRRKAEALRDLGRGQEAIATLESELGGAADALARRDLVALCRKLAARYCSASDRALLEKAFGFADRPSVRGDIAAEMGDWRRALDCYRQSAAAGKPCWGERGDCLFALRDFAGAAAAYAKWGGRQPAARCRRAAQASIAVGDAPAACAALEKALAATRGEAEKTEIRYQLSRLRARVGNGKETEK